MVLVALVTLLLALQETVKLTVDVAGATLLAYRNDVSKFPKLGSLPAATKINVLPTAFYFDIGVGGGAVDRQTGKVLGYRSFGHLGRSPNSLPERLDQDACEGLARKALTMIGRPYQYRISHAQEDGPLFHLWFETYQENLHLVGCNVSATIDRALGEVENVEVNGPVEGVFPLRPATLGFEPADLPAARGAVASAAFAEARARRFLSVDVLDATDEPERGLWLASRSGGSGDEPRAPGPTGAQLSAAARGEGTPVWIVTLRGDERPFKGEAVALPIVRGYVDAATGRLLRLQYIDGRGAGGGSPRGASRPAPALSGPAGLTAGGRTRAVRLVPVAATRPFSASGQAVLRVGRRMLETEYDPKAGLVRFRGRLARTLDP